MKVAEKTTLVRLDVCEVKPIQQKMVTGSATEIDKQIAANGKVGVSFATKAGADSGFTSALLRMKNKPHYARRC